MPSTRPDQLRVDQYLDNYSVGYAGTIKGFVADDLAPRQRVPLRSGKFFRWDEAEDFRAPVNAYHRPGTRSSSIDIKKKEDGKYACEGYALHVVVADQDQQDSPNVDLRLRKTRRLTKAIMQAREMRVAAVATNPNNFPTDHVVDLSAHGVKSWADPSGDPFAQLEAGLEKVSTTIGVVPNRLLIPYHVALRLREHPEYIKRFKHWTDTVKTMALPDTILDMKPVVPRAVKNSAPRDVASTFTPEVIWGDHVVLYYVEDQQDDGTIEGESIATFKTFDCVSQEGTYHWYEPSLRSQVIEKEEVVDEQLVAGLTGYMLTNVLTPVPSP